MFSVVTGKGSNAAIQLLHTTIIGNVFVACSTMVLLQIDSRLCTIPVFLACPIAYYFYNREGFTKWKSIVDQAKGPRGITFPQVSNYLNFITQKTKFVFFHFF